MTTIANEYHVPEHMLTDLTEPPEGMAWMSIPDRTGDTRIMWDPTNKDEVDAAKAAYDTAKSKGMLSYLVSTADPSKPGEVVHSFPKKAGKLIMVRQTAGG